MDRYAVIGNPVEHSISPRIHRHFAEQTGQSLEYGRLLAPLDGFVEVAARFFAEGGKGVNVTVPFKSEAAAWVDWLDPLAELAGAVNTIKADASELLGFNTDGSGLVRDLEFNHHWSLEARRILLVGAGGAACGVVGPLLDAGAGELVIANRTPERAARLVARFVHAAPGAALRACGFAELRDPFDMIINATSAGLRGESPAIADSVVEGALCYDMLYGRTTPFCEWAKSHGAAAVADGIGMLVEQAADAFRVWRGVRPETSTLLAELRRERTLPQTLGH